MGIEFHPVPKNHSGTTHTCLEDYIEERRAQLEENSFAGDLIVISNLFGLYQSFRDRGIVKNWYVHCAKLEAARKKIEAYDLSLGIKPKPKKSRKRRLEEFVVEEPEEEHDDIPD